MRKIVFTLCLVALSLGSFSIGLQQSSRQVEEALAKTKKAQEQADMALRLCEQFQIDNLKLAMSNETLRKSLKRSEDASHNLLSNLSALEKEREFLLRLTNGKLPMQCNGVDEKCPPENPGKE